MKHMKIVNMPATTKLVLDCVTCDFCGALIANQGYRVSEVTLAYREGTQYPEGGRGETTTLDCCEACWKQKVLPRLRDLGAMPRIEKWAW